MTPLSAGALRAFFSLAAAAAGRKRQRPRSPHVTGPRPWTERTERKKKKKKKKPKDRPSTQINFPAPDQVCKRQLATLLVCCVLVVVVLLSSVGLVSSSCAFLVFSCASCVSCVSSGCYQGSSPQTELRLVVVSAPHREYDSC